MFTMSKKGVSNSYRLADGAKNDFGVIAGCGGGQTGSIELQGRSLTFTPGDDDLSYSLDVDSIAAATATRERHHQHFVIDHGGSVVEAVCDGGRTKPYEVQAGGASLGSISLSRFTGRVVTVDIAEQVPFEVQLFAGWLALRTWNAGAQTRIYPT